MEDLTGFLESNLNVGLDDNSSVKSHPRFSQFKIKSSKISQEERRRITLENQKQLRYLRTALIICTFFLLFVGFFNRKRFNYQNFCRRLAENDFTPDADDYKKSSDAMEWHGSERLKVPRPYKDQIMLSEWLDQVPSDFEKDWIIVGWYVA